MFLKLIIVFMLFSHQLVDAQGLTQDLAQGIKNAAQTIQQQSASINSALDSLSKSPEVSAIGEAELQIRSALIECAFKQSEILNSAGQKLIKNADPRVVETGKALIKAGQDLYSQVTGIAPGGIAVADDNGYIRLPVIPILQGGK